MFELVNVTGYVLLSVLVVLLLNFIVAVKYVPFPFSNVVLVGDTVTPVTVIGVGVGVGVVSFTVILQYAVFPPQLATIAVEPAFTPVTVPVELTVATEVSLLFHVTVLSVALLGVTVAVNVILSPSTILALVLFKLTPVTATVFFIA